jgi:hypothetical protein
VRPRSSPPFEISFPSGCVHLSRVGSNFSVAPCVSQMRERTCGWIASPPMVCAHGGDSANAFPNSVGGRSPRSRILGELVTG